MRQACRRDPSLARIFALLFPLEGHQRSALRPAASLRQILQSSRTKEQGRLSRRRPCRDASSRKSNRLSEPPPARELRPLPVLSSAPEVPLLQNRSSPKSRHEYPANAVQTWPSS